MATMAITMMAIPRSSSLLLLVFLAGLLPQLSSALNMVTNNNKANTVMKPVPVTVLSGFLGSGKTTLLQNMLQNKEGLKIGIVVNDVAEVNIDSKLVARQQAATEKGESSSIESQADCLVQLSNGCACCSLGDELMVSVRQLLTINELRKSTEQFDHIVVEMSGVADPKQVRSKFQEAFQNMRMMNQVKLDTMVTLVDTSTFRTYLESQKVANTQETPELFFREDSDKQDLEGELSKKLDPILVGAVMAGVKAAEEENNNNAVANLLVTQTETADLVILNKEDLVDNREIIKLTEIIKALNPRANIITSSYGQLPISNVLAVAGGKGIADYDTMDDHRNFVDAVDTVMEVNDNNNNKKEAAVRHSHSDDHADCEDPDCTDSSHSHSHSHHDDDDDDIVDKDTNKESHSHSRDHTTAVDDATSHSHSHDHECTDPDCNDTSHSHSHDHDCSDPDCTDTSHSHSHDHACSDPDCTDTTHSHSHDHACSDPDCTDTTHSHSHDHAKETKTSHEGIGSFVYKARRPFHPSRLASFLQYLPVVRGVPTSEEMEEEEARNKKKVVEISDDAKLALKSCLRSKGFVWCADSHNDALYWSHAGASFELTKLGSWWATLPREFWPEGTEAQVLPDFDNIDHDDFTNPVGVGDRRQEVVFIGTGLGGPNKQTEIRDALSQCLLDDTEYEEYKSIQQNECQLQSRFSKIIEPRPVKL